MAAPLPSSINSTNPFFPIIETDKDWNPQAERDFFVIVPPNFSHDGILPPNLMETHESEIIKVKQFKLWKVSDQTVTFKEWLEKSKEKKENN